MGQKTNPIGFRLAVTKDWGSKWFAEKKDFGKLLAEDPQRFARFLKDKLEGASVSKNRPRTLPASRCRVTIFTPPALVSSSDAKAPKLTN